MSAIASDKEAHPVCITIANTRAHTLLASTPHRVLARMVGSIKKKNAISFKKTKNSSLALDEFFLHSLIFVTR